MIMPRVSQKNKKVVKKTRRIVKKEKKSTLLAKVYNYQGEELEEISLPKEIFSIKVNPKLLAQYIRVYLTNQRQGTVSTKTRGEVAGSTRKIYRQKGTGKARHGSIKAPIFVGGGVVGGPKPRDFLLKINKKQKRKVFLGSLTLKLEEGAIICLADDFLKIKPKTKNMVNFFDKVGIADKKNLLVLPKLEKNNLILASRNIPGVKITDVQTLNSYQVLAADKILFLKTAINNLIDKLKKSNENK
ncbi:MAG: 50S ribosomal protein L4 [Microgenomates group bacterium]|nr:50S ribosomal protein L4 [Microgenomates group bacterium]